MGQISAQYTQSSPAAAAPSAALLWQLPSSAASRRVVANFWQKFDKFRSFSAVSTPISARKYAFCSIFQNLPDYLADNFETWQFFLQIFAPFCISFNAEF
jgi:hypothetical protein